MVSAMLAARNQVPEDAVSRITTFGTEDGVVAVCVESRGTRCEVGHEPVASQGLETGSGESSAEIEYPARETEQQGELAQETSNVKNENVTPANDGLIGPPPPEAFAAYANKTFNGLDLLGKILRSMHCSRHHCACLELVRKDGCSSIVFISARSGSEILHDDGSCKLDVVEVLEGLKGVAEV